MQLLQISFVCNFSLTVVNLQQTVDMRLQMFLHGCFGLMLVAETLAVVGAGQRKHRAGELEPGRMEMS